VSSTVCVWYEDARDDKLEQETDLAAGHRGEGYGWMVWGDSGLGVGKGREGRPEWGACHLQGTPTNLNAFKL
jgi:hypothetical protein